ncbi:MAG: hypothetical protein A3K77_07575 [Euryarchaeota archaeon RBG_13_31_8]|nr:MAG: hypothetical protein A3K77_07575 [Euryarchaeota archaeon RBG_13_31_8]
MNNEQIETYIEIPFSFYFKHKYKDAPKQVSFLRQKHPHDFDCLITIETFHNERELEFYMVREYLNSQINTIKRNIKETASCECISDVLEQLLRKKYGKKRAIIIRVKEDNKYGSLKIYKPLLYKR